MNKTAVIRNWLLCTTIALITLPTDTYAEDTDDTIKVSSILGKVESMNLLSTQ